ncbi:MAG: ABC transporter ATP-binding protein [Chloroflexota bacterium]
MTTSVAFENVFKGYRRASSAGSLRDTLASLRRAKTTEKSQDTFWALQDVTFDIRRGEVLGLIGHNGAGKSTILKLMAGITEPTSGRIGVAGRVGCLIELGAGFHPELTGRENIFLNGQIMGMSRREVDSLYDAIVDLAELRDFMNEPVKHYSSGMYARLGFAVAIHVDPDILLVDEVLSVGDASFQRRSLERMSDLVNRGKAVVIVSHNLLAIERMCDSVIWLERGRIKMRGDAAEVMQAYLSSEEERLTEQSGVAISNDSGLVIRSVELTSPGSESDRVFAAGCDLTITIQLHAERKFDALQFNVNINGTHGPLFAANMLLDGRSLELLPGDSEISCTFVALPLLPGAYRVMGEVWEGVGYRTAAPWSEWARFRVDHVPAELLSVSNVNSVLHLHGDAPVLTQYKWNINSDNAIS